MIRLIIALMLHFTYLLRAGLICVIVQNKVMRTNHSQTAVDVSEGRGPGGFLLKLRNTDTSLRHGSKLGSDCFAPILRWFLVE